MDGQEEEAGPSSLPPRAATTHNPDQAPEVLRRRRQQIQREEFARQVRAAETRAEDRGPPFELWVLLAVLAAAATAGAYLWLSPPGETGGLFGLGGGSGGFGGGLDEDDGYHRGRKVEDTSMEVTVPLEAVYNGQTVKVDFPGMRQVKCDVCHGKGGVGRDGVATCGECHGTGMQTLRVRSGPFVQTIRQTCPSCGGHGKIIKHLCPKCKGKGVTHQHSDFSVDIPAGAPERYLIRLPYKGHQMPGVRSGDVVIRLTTKPHPVFRRQGRDLHARIDVALKEALLGFSRTLTHLDGRQLVIERDGSEVTTPDTVITLPCEGMPSFAGGWSAENEAQGIPRPESGCGDLYVTFRIRMPKNLTPQDKERVNELLTG